MLLTIPSSNSAVYLLLSVLFQNFDFPCYLVFLILSFDSFSGNGLGYVTMVVWMNHVEILTYYIIYDPPQFLRKANSLAMISAGLSGGDRQTTQPLPNLSKTRKPMKSHFSHQIYNSRNYTSLWYVVPAADPIHSISNIPSSSAFTRTTTPYLNGKQKRKGLGSTKGYTIQATTFLN